MAEPDVAPSWYHDETSLLEALKRSSVHGGRTPMIAGYDNLREINRGGQGVVYSAQQRSTRRQVAIKVLLDGVFSSNAARRRFEREIDLVASLKHPNVVQVYDSGVTAPPDERLYFVMEFIDGRPLTEFARERDRREVLSLFAEICDAVNYAHQRGVIHRDLKPSNIRVDSAGRPHVLDFGLAKIAGSTDAPAAAAGATMSVTGQFLGSLPWASPEQADGATDRIDTRSDVYALGVILYQLLTGRFPYDVEASFREVLDHILRDDPQRPSALTPDVDSDLDTITLKCLSKDPARRYQTAGELAQDLRHHLAGEPIDARRDSMWYVTVKRLRRHRVLTAAAVLLMITLVSGIAATMWQAHRARQQRERAEQRFNDVRNLAHTFIFEFNDQIANLAGARPARELLVTTALQYLQNLSAEAGDDDPELHSELAAAWQQVGSIQGDPYQSNLGDTAGALRSYERSLTIRRRLAEAEPDNSERQRLLAGVLNEIGDVRLFMADRSGAVDNFEQAIAVLDRALPANPNDPGLLRELAASAMKTGDCLVWLKDQSRAAAQYQRAMDLLRPLHDHDPSNVRETLNIAVAHSKLGHMSFDAGDLPAAAAHYQASLDLLEEQRARDPDNALVRRNIAISHNDLSAVCVANKSPADAMTHLAESLAISQSLFDADPQDALAASDLAYTHNRVADVQFNLKQPEGALDHYRQALEIREGLSTRDPNNASVLRDMGVSRTMVASAHYSISQDAARPDAERISNLHQAIAWYSAANEVFFAMRERGWLGERDLALPENVNAYIATCEKDIAAINAAGTRPQ